MTFHNRSIKFPLIAFLLTIMIFSGIVQLAPGAFATGFPVTLTDDADRTVTIPSNPQKIVSLGPSSTEILFALGVGDRVVGVTEYCDYPPQVKTLVEQGKITIIGGFSTPNIELILGLESDLVLGHTLMGQDNLKTLEDAGIPTLILDPHDLEGVYKDIEMVGKATGSSEAAEALINAMKEHISQVQQTVSSVSDKVKVVQMCWLEPIWTAGGDTFINAAIEAAGGINVFSEISGYVTVSAEAVIDKDPDIIIYTSMSLTVSSDEIFKEIREMFPTVNAVRNGRVYLLIGDAASMLERPGPGLVDGIETLAKIFYPSLYGGEVPHVITERKVSVFKIKATAGYSEEQIKALKEAKTILKMEGNVKKAYEKLLENAIITTEIPSIPVNSPTYKMLIELYGENLGRYPSPEGRIQLLYAMGKLNLTQGES